MMPFKSLLSTFFPDTEDTDLQYENYSVQNEDSKLLHNLKMSSLSLASSPPESFVGATVSKPSSSSSKKNRRKKKNNSNALLNSSSSAKVSKPMRMLKDLFIVQREQLTLMLDVGYGANWKQIAQLFSLTPDEIRAIESSNYLGESPTESLFQLLMTRIPNLTLDELKSKCRSILRNDVAEIIDKLSGE